MKKSATFVGSNGFFVPLQREGWVNLQRPALIPAKLNAWLFYLNDIFRKMLACLLALCTIVSCSQDAEDVLAGQDGTASSKDIRKVLNSVSKEWGKSRDALINEMEGYNLVEGTREDMLQFKHPKKEQCISFLYL